MTFTLPRLAENARASGDHLAPALVAHAGMLILRNHQGGLSTFDLGGEIVASSWIIAKVLLV